MLQPVRPARIIRFGLFEADFAARELRREGSKVKLQERPFEILSILLEHPNEVVTREQFRQRLWPADTFVDFDHSLNTSVNRLRQALRDDAENPRFIATVGRVGYRFIAPASQVSGNGNSPAAGHVEAPVAGSPPSVRVQTSDSIYSTRKTWRVAIVLAITGTLAAVVFAVRHLLPHGTVRVQDIVKISHSSNLDPWGRITADGSRLFFLGRAGDHWNLMQVPASGGDAVTFSETYRNMKVVNVSPDHSEFLAFTFVGRVPDLPLWLVPVVGGPPRRVGNIVADDAVFTPDGRQITFDGADGIYICERNGSDIRKVVSLPGRSAFPAWSKDGQRLRFTLFDNFSSASTIWEVNADGGNLHPIFANWALSGSEKGGRWSTDGRYYFFESSQAGVQTVWVVPDHQQSWVADSPQPIQLTFGPSAYGLPVPSDDGRSLYVWGGQDHRDLMRYDEARRTFARYLPHFTPGWLAFSPDGSQTVYDQEHSLWISSADGSGARPLAFDFAAFRGLSWSPQGQRIVFGAIRKGESALRFFVVPAAGGTPTEIDLGRGADWPAWSADGNAVFYSKGYSSGAMPAPESGIYSLDLQTSEIARIPRSENLEQPSPSPDGKYLTAVTEIRSEELTHIKMFDFSSKRWIEIAHGALLTGTSWSRDSGSFYYQDLLSPGQPIYRYDLNSRESQQILDFNSQLQGGYLRCGFSGLAPDGSILAVMSHGDADIHRIDLSLP